MRAVLTSRWSALECLVLASNRQRYTHSPKPSPTFPRYQFTNSHGQPEGGGGRVLHCCHPRCSRSGTINIIILGRSSAGRGRKPEILTKQSLSSRINKYRLKNSQLKYSRPEDTGKLKKERNSTKLHKTTKLQTVPGENETNKRQKDNTQFKKKKKSKMTRQNGNYPRV